MARCRFSWLLAPAVAARLIFAAFSTALRHAAAQPLFHDADAVDLPRCRRALTPIAAAYAIRYCQCIIYIISRQQWYHSRLDVISLLPLMLIFRATYAADTPLFRYCLRHYITLIFAIFASALTLPMLMLMLMLFQYQYGAAIDIFATRLQQRY